MVHLSSVLALTSLITNKTGHCTLYTDLNFSAIQEDLKYSAQVIYFADAFVVSPPKNEQHTGLEQYENKSIKCELLFLLLAVQLCLGTMPGVTKSLHWLS